MLAAIHSSLQYTATKCILVLLIFASFAALGVAAWSKQDELLQAAPDLWAVSDVVEPADAVAVFGGGYGIRPQAAVEYYRNGLVSKILVANVRAEEVHAETAFNCNELLRLGIPWTAIELIGDDLTSTYDEAVALKHWAQRNHARRVIVPTEHLASRRVRWIVLHELAGTGTQAIVHALNDPTFKRNEWWKDKESTKMFRLEFIKYLCYRLRYFAWRDLFKMNALASTAAH